MSTFRHPPVYWGVPHDPQAHLVLDLPDRVLVTRAQRGDVAAFRSLYEHHVEAAHRLAARLLGDRADLADDAVQEGFVRAFSALGRFRGESSFRTWLHRVVARCVVDLQRRESGRSARHVGLDHAASVHTPDVGDARELSVVVSRALDAMPDALRAVVVLYDIEGYAHREIAAMLGVPEGTARRRLTEARAQLRDVLARAGYSPRDLR